MLPRVVRNQGFEVLKCFFVFGTTGAPSDIVGTAWMLWDTFVTVVEDPFRVVNGHPESQLFGCYKQTPRQEGPYFRTFTSPPYQHPLPTPAKRRLAATSEPFSRLGSPESIASRS